MPGLPQPGSYDDDYEGEYDEEYEYVDCEDGDEDCEYYEYEDEVMC